jgi:putative endonuclease
MGKAKIELGERGENIALDFLRKNGYHILAENFRSPLGEIDLVAREGAETVFVEVKTRRSLEFGMPEESVTSGKQKQILKSALIYLKGKGFHEVNCRFDVISIIVDNNGKVKRLKLIKNAFEPG